MTDVLEGVLADSPCPGLSPLAHMPPCKHLYSSPNCPLQEEGDHELSKEQEMHAAATEAVQGASVRAATAQAAAEQATQTLSQPWTHYQPYLVEGLGSTAGARCARCADVPEPVPAVLLCPSLQCPAVTHCAEQRHAVKYCATFQPWILRRARKVMLC